MATSLFDQMLRAMGGAIDDIREKVVEEPWFGRATSHEHGAAPADAGFDARTGGLSEAAPQAPGEAVHFDRDTGRFSDNPGPARSNFDSLLAQHAARQGLAQEPSREREHDREIDR